MENNGECFSNFILWFLILVHDPFLNYQQFTHITFGGWYFWEGTSYTTKQWYGLPEYIPYLKRKKANKLGKKQQKTGLRTKVISIERIIIKSKPYVGWKTMNNDAYLHYSADKVWILGCGNHFINQKRFKTFKLNQTVRYEYWSSIKLKEPFT